MSEYNDLQLLAEDLEREFWYIFNNWDKYMEFCEGHSPEDFPIPDIETSNFAKYKFCEIRTKKQACRIIPTGF